jgi:hypothetical protein
VKHPSANAISTASAIFVIALAGDGFAYLGAMLGARGIVRFNDYVVRRLSGWFAEHMPLCLKNAGGSLYIRRTEK